MCTNHGDNTTYIVSIGTRLCCDSSAGRHLVVLELAHNSTRVADDDNDDDDVDQEEEEDRVNNIATSALPPLGSGRKQKKRLFFSFFYPSPRCPNPPPVP